jgi:hypothetical protein
MLGCSAARPMTPALLGLVLAAAPAVGYVQATGWYERPSNAAHYQPLHLVDGDLRTVWCSSGGDALAETITLGLGAPVGVDEVRIATGNQADATAFHTFARPRTVGLRTEERAALLGTWYAGDDGAPDRSLSFFVDGTWMSRTVVYGEPTRPKVVTGQWGFDKKSLWMKAGSTKGPVKPIQETKADARGKPRTTLQLSGGLPADLKVTFRDRP